MKYEDNGNHQDMPKVYKLLKKLNFSGSGRTAGAMRQWNKRGVTETLRIWTNRYTAAWEMFNAVTKQRSSGQGFASLEKEVAK